MGFIVATSALSTLVIAADVPNANPEQLAEPYVGRSEDHFSSGVRFFYCQGLAVALLSMGAIALSHDHREFPTLRWAKRWRMANRIGVCIILFFLPMSESLNSLSLISTTLGLSAWVLIVELFGKACTEDSFIHNKSGRCVRYSAKCHKKDVENELSSGNSRRRSADVMEMGKGEMTAI